MSQMAGGTKRDGNQVQIPPAQSILGLSSRSRSPVTTSSKPRVAPADSVPLFYRYTG
ncbi:MAG: hypothetical protein MAG715_00071 [Methanonatronarchaeales archaeon]|nr:hypothetical protein [Methanonatronarchaeales archaeon]